MSTAEIVLGMASGALTVALLLLLFMRWPGSEARLSYVPKPPPKPLPDPDVPMLRHLHTVSKLPGLESPGERLLLLHLLALRDDFGETHLPTKTLAELAAMHRTTTAASLRRFQVMGLIHDSGRRFGNRNEHRIWLVPDPELPSEAAA